MSEQDKFSKYLSRSVNHIFKNFLDDNDIEEVYETQIGGNAHQIAVEISGDLSGEVIINLPEKTLNLITKKFLGSASTRKIKDHHGDVAGEIANLITGTFANQLQYTNRNIELNPPEFNDDPISMKALYDNINLSFKSKYGGFDVDFYYRKNS